MRENISIKGAKENNLNNVSVEIPRNKLTVVTGVSGSGKSSLVFDVIYEEGKQKFFQSIVGNSKIGVSKMKKINVDMINGMSPVISLPQKRGIHNPRSTVASMADLSRYIRLLYSTISTVTCPYCKEVISTKSIKEIMDHISLLPLETKVEIWAPLYKDSTLSYEELFNKLSDEGYYKVSVDGEVVESTAEIDLCNGKEYRINVFVGQFKNNVLGNEVGVELVERAVNIGRGFLIINIGKDKNELADFYNDFLCKEHNMIATKFKPDYFSVNELEYACEECLGIGMVKETKPYLLIKDESKSLIENPFYIEAFNKKSSFSMSQLQSLSHHYNFSIDTPYKDLPEKVKDVLFYGTRGETYEQLKPNGDRYEENRRFYISYKGLIHTVNETQNKRLKELSTEEEMHRDKLFVEVPCSVCKGKKLKKLALLSTIDGKDIYELGELQLKDLIGVIKKVKNENLSNEHIGQLLNQIIDRIQLLIDIGLGYLKLNRRADSLSGGEAQRIRLANQIGSELMGMIYVLDEPSIGLHERDTVKVIDILKKLRDIGNTVIVVEHDIETIKNGDYILELGPGAGVLGGTIMASGPINEVMKNENFLTGRYIKGENAIKVPSKRRKPNKFIRIEGARENNLKNISIDVPLEALVCITGISGSGKSTLINDILYKAVYNKLYDERVLPGACDKVSGVEQVRDIIYIDQNPIGKSSRSNPATYLGIYNKIRDMFSKTDRAIEAGLTPSHFSFNSDGGRCEACMGEGELSLGIQFMDDAKVTCHVCKGRRFKKQVLDIKYKGKNIADVLDLSIEEGVEFFKDIPAIYKKLNIVKKLGLGYIKLGQSSSTISGGEAQRLKLSKELTKTKENNEVLYILDEPTTGLHINDIEKLLIAFNELLDGGNSLVVIEHNLDVIKMADYIIDLGPEGGSEGGDVLVTGTPEEVVLCDKSFTGKYLKNYL